MANPNKRLRITFRAIDGAEQAIIPAPDGPHMRHHTGKNPTVCDMTPAQVRTWKRQWGHMVEILSEEKYMRVSITCAEGEHVVTLPYPSNRKPTRVWEGKTTIADMPDQVIAQLQKKFKKRITITAVPVAPAKKAAPATKAAPKKKAAKKKVAKKAAPKKKAKGKKK